MERKDKTMKNMKKMMALVIATMMIAMYAVVPAWAAESDTATVSKFDASVTVSGIKTGNTLNLYRIVAFNLDESNNSISYNLATGLPAAYDTIDELAELSEDGYVFTEGSTSKAAADTLANMIAQGTVTPLATINQVAASDAATLNLPAGWYIATVSGTNDTSLIYQNMIIDAMPIVDEANNGYKKADAISFTVKHSDVVVNKGVGSDADLTAETDTTDKYSVGDTVPFKIGTNIPNYPTPSKEASFSITDTPTALTDDITNNFVVKVDGTPVESSASSWSVARPDGNTDGFVITFVKDYILANAGKSVEVTYNAVIKDSAVIADDGLTATNTANIKFNPNPNETATVEPEDTTELYTYGINVLKYDETAGTSKALTGAKFVLYKADGTTVAGAETEVDENGYVSWDGLAAGTYKLVETQAPAGYVLDSTPKEIVVSDSTAATDDRVTDGTTETCFLQTDIPNRKGQTLPETGGIGTTLFYLIGAILVLGAGVVLVTRRRVDGTQE